MTVSIDPSKKDWAGNFRLFSRAWGLPLLVMVEAHRTVFTSLSEAGDAQ